MPTVLRTKGYRIGFFSADGDEPPHVHVANGEKQAKFWLDRVQLARDAGYSRSELNEIFDLVRDHQQELLRAWHE